MMVDSLLSIPSLWLKLYIFFLILFLHKCSTKLPHTLNDRLDCSLVNHTAHKTLKLNNGIVFSLIFLTRTHNGTLVVHHFLFLVKGFEGYPNIKWGWSSCKHITAFARRIINYSIQQRC